GHSLYDHSFHPDAVMLRIRTQNFVVSASYLAMQSPFFYDLFYGPNSGGLNGRYELDFDPHTFGDLLDMVYPCCKYTQCCADCSSSTSTRFSLALHLKMTFAMRRMISERVMGMLELEGLVKEKNRWEEYSYLFPSDKQSEERGVKSVPSLPPVLASFPDTTTVIVNGVPIRVSATTLALHSPILRSMLFVDKCLANDVKIDMDVSIFLSILRLTAGIFPSEWSGRELDALTTLGITGVRDAFLQSIKHKVMLGRASRDCKQLMLHLLKEKPLDVGTLELLSGYVDKKELDEVMMECTDIPPDVKTNLAKPPEEKFHVFVKTYTGATRVIWITSTISVLAFVKLLEWHGEALPPCFPRMVFSGKMLEPGKL
ncbi:hypothetical protein PMAYCL1PPCAC_02753, partial [Pristionchus mayeri]